MKWLIVLLVVLAGIWWLRRTGRLHVSGSFQANLKRRSRPSARPPRGSVTDPQVMVRCAHCGVHLPQVDALQGVRGNDYCCAEHRRLLEG